MILTVTTRRKLGSTAGRGESFRRICYTNLNNFCIKIKFLFLEVERFLSNKRLEYKITFLSLTGVHF